MWGTQDGAGRNISCLVLQNPSPFKGSLWHVNFLQNVIPQFARERALTMDQLSVRSSTPWASSPQPVSFLALPSTQVFPFTETWPPPRNHVAGLGLRCLSLGCGSTLVTLIVMVIIIKGTPEPGILLSLSSQVTLEIEFPGDGAE